MSTKRGSGQRHHAVRFCSARAMWRASYRQEVRTRTKKRAMPGIQPVSFLSAVLPTAYAAGGAAISARLAVSLLHVSFPLPLRLSQGPTLSGR